MGAAARARAVERASSLFFFGKLPKLDHQLTGREPTALFERIKRIAQVEGPSGDEKDALSSNEVRVWLTTWGACLHEWMQKHKDGVIAAAKSEAMYPEEVIFRLLEEALAAREPPAKKSGKK